MAALKKQVLVTISSLAVGGSQRSIVSILRSIPSENYSVDVYVTGEQTALEDQIPKNMSVFVHGRDFTLFNNSTVLKVATYAFGGVFLRRRCKRILTKNYDVALAFDGYNNTADLLAAHSRATKKYIWVHSCYAERAKHTRSFRVKLLLMRHKYSLFDKIICVSKSAQQSFAVVSPEHADRTEVLWNLLDTIRIDKLKVIKPTIRLNGSLNFVSIGSLHKHKGHELTIRAFVGANISGAKLYIIGGGPQEDSLGQLISALHAERTVTLLGGQNNPYNILSQADCMILASEYEGFGIVLLESFYLSIPVLATKSPGIEEVVTNIAPDGAAKMTIRSTDALVNAIRAFTPATGRHSALFDTDQYNECIIRRLCELLEGK